MQLHPKGVPAVPVRVSISVVRALQGGLRLRRWHFSRCATGVRVLLLLTHHAAVCVGVTDAIMLDVNRFCQTDDRRLLRSVYLAMCSKALMTTPYLNVESLRSFLPLYAVGFLMPWRCDGQLAIDVYSGAA